MSRAVLREWWRDMFPDQNDMYEIMCRRFSLDSSMGRESRRELAEKRQGCPWKVGGRVLSRRRRIIAGLGALTGRGVVGEGESKEIEGLSPAPEPWSIRSVHMSDLPLKHGGSHSTSWEPVNRSTPKEIVRNIVLESAASGLRIGVCYYPAPRLAVWLRGAHCGRENSNGGLGWGEVIVLSDCTVDGGGKVKKGKSKKKLELRKAQSLEEAQLEIQQHNKNLTKQSLLRCQYLCARASSAPPAPARGKDAGPLDAAYICALQKEVPYHGRLYVSENYVCFYSSVLLKDTKVVIPVTSVLIVKKQNTALLVPNALSIRTSEGEKYLFVSLRNRESCYKLLRSVCPQLESSVCPPLSRCPLFRVQSDGSTNSSPLFSSVENSFDQCKHTNSSQSSLEDSFEQLDGGDAGLLLNAPSPKLTRAPVPHGNSPAPRRTVRRETEDSSTEEDTGSSWVWSVTENVRSHLSQSESGSLNTLLFIYLLLMQTVGLIHTLEQCLSRMQTVGLIHTLDQCLNRIQTVGLIHTLEQVLLLLLSSGYIGLRIVALEEQLTSLGALPEFSIQSGKSQALQHSAAMRNQRQLAWRSTGEELERHTSAAAVPITSAAAGNSVARVIQKGVFIMALEEQLTSLGALPEFSLQSGILAWFSDTVPDRTEVQIFNLVISIPTFILGLVGNTAVLAVFCCRRRGEPWSYMMVYITNMAFADCIMLISLPFKMYSYQNEWTLLPNFCLVLVSSHYVNMYVSIFTATAISVVRYMAIKYPFRAKEIMCPWKAFVVCVLIWLVICSFSACFHFVDAPNGNTTHIKCFQKNRSEPLPLSFILVLELVGYLLPLITMVFCSVEIISTLSKEMKIGSRSAEKIQCIRIIATNLIVFIVCFSPFHFGFLLKYFVETYIPSDCNMLEGVHNLIHTSFCIANANCCLDAFTYYFATKDSWKKLSVCCDSHIFNLVISIPTFILGLVGNTAVLAVFCCRRRGEPWSYMMVYITNMAFADCIMLISLPFKMYSYQNEWTLLPNFCLVLVSSHYVNMYVSIFTATAISVVRYMAIKYPFRAKEIMCPWKAFVVCVLIWLVICSFSACFHFVDAPNGNTTHIKCFQKNRSEPLPLSFILVLELVGYLLPLITMVFCSVEIISTLSKEMKIGSWSAEKIQCIRIIATNLIVFIVCFSPFHFGFLLKYFVETYIPSDCNMLEGVHNLIHTSFCIANASCCLDAFTYYFATKDSWTKLSVCCDSHRHTPDDADATPPPTLTTPPWDATPIHNTHPPPSDDTHIHTRSEQLMALGSLLL
ncbi:hypothetical protein AAFF_G00004320 [Aldrovandia affinis]|uniref:G-protein coupled receptors family 1 profile domain-containing protein n=1 Tax=Aldrovandia affinis TaxID=143900 RepID=A0AAD7X3S2_9TELE|nr:hypothetical protein AAFF_G00004320 [Aldrovandia affinis]